MLTHGSLFSGIGGFDLAAQWAGIPTLWEVEKDPYCRAVLAKHFPEAKRYDDIKECKQLESVDIVSGGFPCQPFSVAGKRTGKEDGRYLWPEMLRVIGQVKPTWVIAENVAGIIRMELDSVLASLEAEGYACWPLVIPACAVDAKHRRDRVWIVAHSDRARPSSEQAQSRPQGFTDSVGSSSDVAHADIAGSQGRHGRKLQKCGTERITRSRSAGNTAITGLPDWSGGEMEEPWPITEFERPDGREVERNFRRVSHGVSRRVDRLRALGNAIVPQVAYQIFKAIIEVDAKDKEAVR